MYCKYAKIATKLIIAIEKLIPRPFSIVEILSEMMDKTIAIDSDESVKKNADTATFLKFSLNNSSGIILKYLKKTMRYDFYRNK